MYEELEELDKANRACIETMKELIRKDINKEVTQLAYDSLEHLRKMQRDLGFGD